MEASIFFGSILIVFVISLIFKKRFGLMGLGLCAGYILNEFAKNSIVKLLGGFSVNGYMLGSDVIQLLIVISPMLVLLFFSKKCKNHILRIVNSLAVAVLSAAFTVSIFSFSNSNLFSYEYDVYNFINSYRSLIIVAGITYSIVDIVLSQSFLRTDKHDRR